MNQCRLVKTPPPTGANIGRRNFKIQNRSVGAAFGASCVPARIVRSTTLLPTFCS